jgi:hypothetical protein
LLLLAGCPPQPSGYADKCESIALGTSIDSLPAQRTEDGGYGNHRAGFYLQAEEGWTCNCGVPLGAYCSDGGPDGVPNAERCGDIYAVGKPYVGERCQQGGVVTKCDVFVRDGGVIAAEAFCAD